MKRTLRRGQTMVEYIIIVCLLAVSLIAVFTYLSRAVGKKAAGATEALSDSEGGKARQAVEQMGEPDQIKPLKQVGE